ncbi:MAG: DNA-binding domain-containing protein, partial [Acidobacteria bacterium]|nr:DNA-binding domain-containing protein [Acidobacteriota bacterium]
MRREQKQTGPGIERLQRWMQAVIVSPGDIDDAIRSPEATSEIPAERLEEVVKPSHSMTSAERVEVYHGMYLLRMVEALEYDYPTVKHYLGEDSFE